MREAPRFCGEHFMNNLSHEDESGSLRMVDVSPKTVTQRMAVAQGRVLLKEAFNDVKNDNLAKGSVMQCARIAGIMAAKNTGNMIPLCHPLNLTSILIDFEFDDVSIIVKSTVKCEGKTGVEMEALAAVSVACLTIYDMAKSVTKNMCIENIQLLTKEGGKSGKWTSEHVV